MISKLKYISRSIWVIDISSVLFVKLYKNKIRNELAIMIAKLNLFKGFLISINPSLKRIISKINTLNKAATELPIAIPTCP